MSDPSVLQSFWRHVDELRSRVIKSLVVFLLACVACFNYADQIIPWIVAPAGHLVFTSPGEGFAAYMTIAITMGLIVSSPYLLYHIWAFIACALTQRERRAIKVFAPLSLVFFLMGVAFAFFVAVPMSYRFLMSFSSPYLVAMITVNNYLGFLGQMLIAFGVTFELPLILAFLAKIGVATPEFLRQKRPHAIIIILIIAAILTPPDVVSQILLALPLMVLYEVGIIFVKMSYKHKTL